MTDHSLAPSFFPGGRLPRGPKEDRLLASRTVSSVLVILVHIFFFFFFAISILKFDERGHRMEETILFLSTQGNDQNARRHLVTPEIEENKEPAVSAAPIAIPRPPPPPAEERGPTATPGDILGAVGQTLACSAGNFEHLTQPERERCHRIPWQGAKTPGGNIVMVPNSVLPRLAEPAPEFRMSGADQLNRDLATGGPPCPILQNTPCLRGILRGNGPSGALGTSN